MSDTNDRTQNVTLWDALKNKAVSVITDGLLERLAVDANITGGNFHLQPFAPKMDFDTTGVVTNTTTWDTLVDVTATEGKLDFVALSAGSSNYEVRLTIDAVVVYTIAMADLSAIGLSNATNVEIWAETADKNFRYHPEVPVDFTTSLKIEVRATVATPTVKHLIAWREVS
jgi:hypothetical protein